MKKIFIEVDFNDKDLAKEVGAKWDMSKKKWFFDKDSKLNKIKKWFPQKKEVVYMKIEASDKEIVNKFHRIEQRFKNGEELLKYLKLDNKKLSKKSGFCPMCDSTFDDAWVDEHNIEILHIWVHAKYFDKSIYLTAREEYFLYEYLNNTFREK